MDFFVLILFSVFVYLIPGNDKDYLAVQSTSGMKGIMAIMIIFHHISQHVTTGITFSNFNYMGWYIVSVFFFLSGYGLYTQFTIKDNYLYNFFKKRVQNRHGQMYVGCFESNASYLFPWKPQ